MSKNTSSPDPALSPVLQKALAASAANDSDLAISLFLEAAQQEPNSAVPQFLLGAELAQLGRIAEAEAAYANSVLIAPGWSIARFELGTLQFTSGRAAIALLTWQPLLDLPASDPLRLFVDGYAALARDEFDEALGYFQNGIAANQINPPLNSNIQLLIDEINRIRATRNPPDADTDVAVSEEENADSHFLISNYQNQGRPH